MGNSLQVTGAIALALRVVGFVIQIVPPTSGPSHTVIRVAAGLALDDASIEGNVPDVTLWDVLGRRIGAKDGESANYLIEGGSFVDIKVQHDYGVANKPTEYIAISEGGNNALCIAYVVITQPDGNSNEWYGDVGFTCGAKWYHSQLTIGDDLRKPKCVWIDDNATNDYPEGMGMHIIDLEETEERTAQNEANRDLLCKSPPRFKMYPKLRGDDPIPIFMPPLEYETGTLVRRGSL